MFTELQREQIVHVRIEAVLLDSTMVKIHPLKKRTSSILAFNFPLPGACPSSGTVMRKYRTYSAFHTLFSSRTIFTERCCSAHFLAALQTRCMHRLYRRSVVQHLLISREFNVESSPMEFNNRHGQSLSTLLKRCGASGFFGHRFGVRRVTQTGVVDVEESQYECGCARGAGRSA
jgi:hypothetical protein